MAISSLGIIISFAIMQIKCYTSFFANPYYDNKGLGLGIISLLLNLFFLGFSIISTIVAFKKKK